MRMQYSNNCWLAVCKDLADELVALCKKGLPEKQVYKETAPSVEVYTIIVSIQKQTTEPVRDEGTEC